MKHFIIILVSFFLIVSGSALSISSCSGFESKLMPCLSFLEGDDPTALCCEGVKEIKSEVKTREDRLALCNCGKKALANLKYDPKRLTILPRKCGVQQFHLPPISKTFDCSKVNYEVEDA